MSARGLVDAATIFRREWLRYRRDRAYWIGQLAFPLVVVGFIGFGLDGVVRLPTGTRYLEHLATGILALLVGSGAVGGGVTLIQDRDSGFLRALLVAPVSRASIVVGKIASRVVASLALVAVLVGILAPFSGVGVAHAGAVVLAVVGITTSFVALGIALASRLRSLESFRLLSALVTVPLYFLSGIFYPVSTLPAPSRALALVNPLSYGVDLLRYGLVGVSEIDPIRSTAILLVLALATTGLAVRVFDARARRA
ncbi:MAG TPA: ABC transporter permease [Myxococcota bacterium]|jgi:ABC-2 type transport system permease protein|nr:ABC transporter permease [Myxococcota bacterium]